MTKYKDYPLDEVVAKCRELTDLGHIIFQKWTCAKCGERATANAPNTITVLCLHEDCGHVTNLKDRGCNYLLLMQDVSLADVAKIIMDDILEDKR